MPLTKALPGASFGGAPLGPGSNTPWRGSQCSAAFATVRKTKSPLDLCGSAHKKRSGRVVWGVPYSFASLLRADAQAKPVVRSSDRGAVDQSCILVGDIGGTNARLSVAQVGPSGDAVPVFEKWYKTNSYANGNGLLDAFTSEPAVMASPPSVACLAVAGEVENGRAELTNKKSWTVEGEEIEKQFGWRVAVINDFEAMGYGVLDLDSSDVLVINDGPTVPKAPKIVIGPGTGLGQAQLLWDEGLQDYRVWPSEGSHADFAPRGDKQTALMRWVVDYHGFCEVEHVACGRGLERIYKFLTDPDNLTASDEPIKKAKHISEEARDGSDPVAVEAVDMMLSIVGGEAGHMALRSLAKGGVYITGGIPPKNLDRVKTGVMQKAFVHKACRFHHILKDIKVSVVKRNDVGLMGVRRYAISLLNGQ